MGLVLKQIEKRNRDIVLFPAFNLHVKPGEILAIYSNLNVRHELLNMLTGKTSMHRGEIMANHKSYVTDREAYLLQVGFCFFEEGFYERLTVHDYLKFFAKLYETIDMISTVIKETQLEPLNRKSIKQLSFSEKKRVYFARLLLQKPHIFIFEEPDLNVDLETKHVLIHLIKRLQTENKAVLILTSNMESAISIADDVYRLDEKGLQKIQLGLEEESESEETVKESAEKIEFHKIPTKVKDKIVLFDPPEIDYIESKAGKSYLFINGESFETHFTLSDLEERLQYFGFFRCHRSYIVNLQKVREVITWTRNSFNLILDGPLKSQIPLSKAKITQLKGMLGIK